MPWKKRNLRGTPVFVLVDDLGVPIADQDGRVDVKYKLDDAAKIYRASVRNLDATGQAEDEKLIAAPPPAAAAVAAGSGGTRENVIIYTDGGSAPNPGPMGIGVVILRGKVRQEIGEFLGDGTNNIAELTAIERALDALTDEDRARNILIHADSAYAIGVVSGAYKAKKNVELVARLRVKAQRFPHLRFVKVAGHAGVAENERCDQLAGAAIAGGRRQHQRR